MSTVICLWLWRYSNSDYLSQLKDHYNNKLTHDGYAKPRKEDLFQKFKEMDKGITLSCEMKHFIKTKIITRK